HSLARSPRVFRKGSTLEEIDSAMSLCRQYSPICQRDSYATETLTEVTLHPYELDQYETTQADFAEFVSEAGYQTVAEVRGRSSTWDGLLALSVPGLSWRTTDEGRSRTRHAQDKAVTHIALADAMEYCRWK